MKAANLVLQNGNIYSIDKDGCETKYNAMAISGGTIVSLGDTDSMTQLIDGNTEIIDLKGRSVLPGLADSHLHVSMTAEMVLDFDLRSVVFGTLSSRQEYIAAYQKLIREYAKAHPEAAIIRGTGWNPVIFEAYPQGQPEASDIDEVCADIPVILRSFDHHALWVNSKAIELAGITDKTPDPRNGVVERDDDGTPSGIFRETTAMDLLLRNLPGADYTVEEYKEGIRCYQREFGNKYGTTLVFDAYCSDNAIKAYRQMEADGELTMRVRTAYYADPSLPESQFDDILSKKESCDPDGDFAIKTVKFFMDGSGLTFYLNDPFEAEWLSAIGMPEGYRGYPQWELEEIKRIFLRLDSSGYQIHIHCMGDGALKLSLDAFEYVAGFNDIRKNRHTIAHVMLADDADIKRMADMGIIAAVQPMWPVADSLSNKSGLAMMGHRTYEVYPFGSLKKAGVKLTCGTDFPVTIPPDPFIGMMTGMLRTVSPAHPEYELYKGQSLGEEKEKLQLRDLIEGYSIASAYQCWLEDVTGSLEVGKSADFIILDADIDAVEAARIADIKVQQTYFKGRKVYETCDL